MQEKMGDRRIRDLVAEFLAGVAAVVLLAGTVLVATVATAEADHNNHHGANQSGPFDPTEVGQGDNQGKGKAPDNGTVGNADGKNPPGQVDNTKDRG